ncbi:MAG: phosphate ABC transporter permease PstA [Dehalococcoidales bacterium]|nr:phosphate ABC transporter permease PstA [Dehalococcoidales bacterium]
MTVWTESYRRRKAVSFAMIGLCGLATAIAVGVLLMVIGYTLAQGIPSLNLNFITQAARPLGEPGGGMRNEIIGTLLLTGLAFVFGGPLGVLGGVFLAEYAGKKWGAFIRLVADALTGVPSIVVGVFVFAVVVRPFHSFSALAGGVALAIIMLPVLARTTEEMVKLVPNTFREAGLALGIPRWRVIMSVVIPGAKAGIVTGIMLSVARIAGETAPLIFTALGNRFGYSGLDQPIGALPLQIWRYALSPYPAWHEQAWAAAFLLIVMVLLLSVVARLLTGWFSRRRNV